MVDRPQRAPMELPLSSPGESPKSRDGPAAAPVVVSGASHRLRALAMLSGSLTDALNPEEAASLVEQKALSALGATGAVVMTLGQFPPARTTTGLPPDTLTTLHAIGVLCFVPVALTRVALDAEIPLAEVARSGTPIFMATEQELLRYADWGAALVRCGVRAAASVPVWANGELRGVLGLTWDAPRVFDDDERAFVLTLGVMCAQAIMRAHLRAAERDARDAAERANRSKTHFLALVSHELRTPMSAVIGYTDLLTDELNGPITDKQRDQLQRVRASGSHLLGLIQQLLDFARIEEGSAHVRTERFLLHDVVAQSLVLVRPLADTKGIALQVLHAEEDAPITLFTDLGKVRQILVNLLANAVKYSERGTVVLRYGLDAPGDAGRVVIDITDAGVGISASDQGHVFDAYWQGDTSSRSVHLSTGLGLSVARQLARLLGGDVDLLRSSPGAGSTFVMTLPARYTAAPDSPPAHAA